MNINFQIPVAANFLNTIEDKLGIDFQIPAAEDFLKAIVCISVVMLALAILAILIILISRIVRAIESAATKKAAPAPAPQTAPTAVTGGADDCEVELIGVDEKTAAVIMAIVSQRSNIPINRLRFKSIRLVEDGKKGGKAK